MFSHLVVFQVDGFYGSQLLQQERREDPDTIGRQVQDLETGQATFMTGSGIL